MDDRRRGNDGDLDSWNDNLQQIQKCNFFMDFERQREGETSQKLK
jgi:hypothetical protein